MRRFLLRYVLPCWSDEDYARRRCKLFVEAIQRRALDDP